MSEATDKEAMEITVADLPMEFKVKYLGKQKGTGLWGIKHTRKPVDLMVSAAKKTPGQVLPFCNLTVTKDGLLVETVPNKVNGSRHKWSHSVDTISYGVQDIVFTRVFSVILINEQDTQNPFEVEAFVCDSRMMARKLTFALAAAFQDYSRRLQEADGNNNDATVANLNNVGGGAPRKASVTTTTTKKFAIDLRSPDEIESELQEQETDA